MTQRTISLNEKSYKILKNLKKKDETYSELITRLCAFLDPSINDPILEYAGIFSEEKELWDKIESVVNKYRKEHLTSDID